MVITLKSHVECLTRQALPRGTHENQIHTMFSRGTLNR